VPLVILLGLIAAAAGVGLLYLLRTAGIAPVGPKPAGALPLEQLDATDAQPLLRMAIAWVPVGLAAGALVALLTRMSRLAAFALLGLVAGIVLVISAGVSDSVTNNESFTQHLATPLGVAGTWVSLALLVIGVALGQVLVAKAAPAPSAA
jgi:hypothetical protein